MFYSADLLSKRSPLGAVWMIAHGKKLSKSKLMGINVQEICEEILEPQVPQSLRLQGILVGGVVVLFSKQQGFLLDDLNEMVRRVKDAGNLKVSQAQVLEDEGGDKGGKAKATLKKGQGKAKKLAAITMVDEQEAELLEGHLDLNNALAGLFAMGSGSLPARAAPLDATQDEDLFAAPNLSGRSLSASRQELRTGSGAGPLSRNGTGTGTGTTQHRLQGTLVVAAHLRTSQHRRAAVAGGLELVQAEDEVEEVNELFALGGEAAHEDLMLAQEIGGFTLPSPDAERPLSGGRKRHMTDDEEENDRLNDMAARPHDSLGLAAVRGATTSEEGSLSGRREEVDEEDEEEGAETPASAEERRRRHRESAARLKETFDVHDQEELPTEEDHEEREERLRRRRREAVAKRTEEEEREELLEEEEGGGGAAAAGRGRSAAADDRVARNKQALARLTKKHKVVVGKPKHALVDDPSAMTVPITEFREWTTDREALLLRDRAARGRLPHAARNAAAGHPTPPLTLSDVTNLAARAGGMLALRLAAPDRPATAPLARLTTHLLDANPPFLRRPATVAAAVGKRGAAAAAVPALDALDGHVRVPGSVSGLVAAAQAQALVLRCLEQPTVVATAAAAAAIALEAAAGAKKEKAGRKRTRAQREGKRALGDEEEEEEGKEGASEEEEEGGVPRATLRMEGGGGGGGAAAGPSRQLLQTLAYQEEAGMTLEVEYERLHEDEEEREGEGLDALHGLPFEGDVEVERLRAASTTPTGAGAVRFVRQGGLVLATSVSLGTKSGVSRDTSSAGQGAGSGGQPSPLRGLLMRPRQRATSTSGSGLLLPGSTGGAGKSASSGDEALPGARDLHWGVNTLEGLLPDLMLLDGVAGGPADGLLRAPSGDSAALLDDEHMGGNGPSSLAAAHSGDSADAVAAAAGVGGRKRGASLPPAVGGGLVESNNWTMLVETGVEGGTEPPAAAVANKSSTTMLQVVGGLLARQRQAGVGDPCVSFLELAQRLTRAEAVKLFMQTLVTHSSSYIRATQHEPFGDIELRAGRRMHLPQQAAA